MKWNRKRLHIEISSKMHHAMTMQVILLLLTCKESYDKSEDKKYIYLGVFTYKM